ncbi:MAG: transcriptional regulator, TetR family [Subtercola sp.]|nr:transcriptional regulator, TetR family [Subtercola sp.]
MADSGKRTRRAKYDERMPSELQRRPGYGAASPSVGARGAATRERIVQETLTLFSRYGYHATTILDIAHAAHVSRSTLYQYFENKGEIFIELLEECGRSILSLAQEVEELGPTERGFTRLMEWVSRWTLIYRKYGTLYVEWTHIDIAASDVNDLVASFLRRLHRRIADLYRRSDLVGITPEDAAVVTTSVVNRFNYFLYVGRRTPPSDAPVWEISAALQLTLFPDTPLDTFDKAPGRRATMMCRHGRGASRRRSTERQARLGDASARSIATATLLVDAGAVVFADVGYHRASVEEIAKKAGFARATFYRYFDDKLDLLLLLSEDCEAALEARLADFPTPISDLRSDPAPLRRWLEEFYSDRDKYIGVIRAWVDRSTRDARLDEAREHVAVQTHDVVVALLGASRLADIVSARTFETMLLALVERLPDALVDGKSEISPAIQERGLELIYTVIRRALWY